MAIPELCGLSIAQAAELLAVKDISALELTEAYAVFPNRGFRAEPFGVRSVGDRSGRSLLEHSPTLDWAMTPEAAAVMVDMLRAVTFEDKPALDVKCIASQDAGMISLREGKTSMDMVIPARAATHHGNPVTLHGQVSFCL